MMPQCLQSWCWQLGLVSSLAMGGAITFLGDCASAQITPDRTLPNNSIVIPQGNTSVIEGGTQAGGNLFQSFEEFSVPTGGAAHFNNALNIQNIFSRVTGGEVSNIDGLLQANGTANVFLLNPNGIIFGPNASLNIGGSFVGSTASSLNFADGTQFSATAPQATPLLTVSVPLGLQYGSNAGSVQVQESILQMQPGQTLALMGGNVSVEGGEFGFLEALGGRIELGGLAGMGIVEIEGQQSQGAFRLSKLRFPDAVERADVLLTNFAYVDVAADGGGSIVINAQNIDISGGSGLRGGLETNLGYPDAQAGDIELSAIEAINVANSFIANNVRTQAVGKGGNIDITAGSLFVTDGAELTASTLGDGDAGDLTIETGRLIIQNGAEVSAQTLGEGRGGNLAVTASESVELIGESADDTIGSRLSVQAFGAGAAGNLTITTGRLIVQDGSSVSAATLGTGRGGNLTVTAADSIEVSGTAPLPLANGIFFNSSLITDTFSEASSAGNAGDLTIETKRLSIRDGAVVSASTIGRGQGGNLMVSATESIELIGTTPDGLSSALATEALGDGDAGDITIETGKLVAEDGAGVTASTFGQGQGGSLTITALESVHLRDTSAKGTPSGLVTVQQGRSQRTDGFLTSGTGAAGNLTVETGRLIVQDGALVATFTQGKGRGGTLTVKASESVELSGPSANSLFPTGLTARTSEAGDAGDLRIETGQLTVRDGAEVTVSSEGLGNAGSLGVAANSIRLSNKALLSSDTTAGQGNIILRSGDLVLRRGSNITTKATGTATGGNITIDTDILAALENSDISANAEDARGGRVIIDTQGIFGTEFRDRENSATSDITATSELGPEFSGIVEINTPDVNPSQGLVNLPVELVDASGLIASACGAGGRQGESKFIVTGRGGLPIRPIDADLEPYPTGTVLSIPSSSQEIFSTLVEPFTNPTITAPTKIVEARGWVINNKGEVVLIASAPNATPHIPWLPSVNCHAPQNSS